MSEQMIRVALRFDDPSPTSDRALEEGVIAAAQKAGIPLNVAVIPFRRRENDLIALTQERATHLVDAARAGVIEVAQHGYCHESAHAKDQPLSEFRGVDAARQAEWIRAGQAVLKTVFGAPVTGFVPPWNTFDAATTWALEDLEFRYLSAGSGMDSGCSPSIAYLPRNCQMTALPKALDALEAFVPLGPVLVAVMHDYDFAESGDPRAPTDLDRFRVLLESLARDERVRTIRLSELAEEPLARPASRLRQDAWAKLPWPIRRRLPRDAMLNQSWPRVLVQSLLRSS